MFSSVPERTMLSTRALLLAGWLILIGSLFWDPFSAALTDPANTASPFHLQVDSAVLQDQVVPLHAYPMGNRIFWTMIVPILPIFLMVFGHEAWRRICPLSFASQIPRYLGLQRHNLVLQRGTGLPERKLPLVARDGWLARNSWYVQGGLLFVGLNARLLLINSDRTALAVAMLAVIGAAVTVGYLWGGKTWCNYFCPANIVQRIYTEPRGLLESRPHLRRTATPQSMCRTAGTRKNDGAGKGDRSACVACTASCGDIDLERSYWDTIENPARRNVYYMFLGLVLGFYGYYYVYSGTWSYYFSGWWTFEPGAAGRLLAPGFWIDGKPVPIPKLVAAPLFLAVCCATTLALGRLSEALYRRRRRGRISEAELLNHALAVSAFTSFNCFYFFGGRPTLLLMPSLVVHAADVLIVAVSTLWLLQTLSRTPLRYRREGLTQGLLEQLRKLKVDISKYFEGRTLEQLRPDEVYVLSKVMPAISHEQRLSAYKNLLKEAISTGKTSSAQFLDVLAEVRAEMEVTDAEHTRLLGELGVEDDQDFDANKATAYEKALCIQNYNDLLGASIADAVASGRTVAAALETEELRATMRILRASFQITDSEHAAMIERLTGEEGIIEQRLGRALEQLRDLCSARFCVEVQEAGPGFWEALEALLLRRLDARVAETMRGALNMLRALGPGSRACHYAASLAELNRAGCLAALEQHAGGVPGTTWRDTLPREVVAFLSGTERRAAPVPLPGADGTALPAYSYRDVVGGSLDRDRCFRTVMADAEPVVAALALTLAAQVEADAAHALAEAAARREHWLTDEVVQLLDRDGQGATAAAAGLIHVSVRLPGTRPWERSFAGSSVSVGSALGNDVVVAHPGVSPYHLALHHDVEGIRPVWLDDAPVLIDGHAPGEAPAILRNGTCLTFGDGDEAPELLLGLLGHGGHYGVQSCDTVSKLVWLSGASLCRGLDLATLAGVAARAEVRRYAAGSRLLEDRSPRDGAAFFVQTGTLAEAPAAALATGAPAPRSTLPTPFPADEAGAARVEWACWPGDGDRAVPQVTSPFAVAVVVTDRDDLTLLAAAAGTADATAAGRADAAAAASADMERGPVAQTQEVNASC